MALPSGTLIVTDAFVMLAANDDEIVSVLAHEAGHVEHHHGLRLVFQNSVVALVITWLVGDVSTLLAAAPTALLQAKYSRDFERDADAYAVCTPSFQQHRNRALRHDARTPRGRG